ncbi:unnamed protein product [Vicia faba]|uniref:Helicase-like transcription factor CHR28 n=1 Tax=Vicia faba TaxID=3906 RepID=A0AAV0Z3F7_VICFA|nr:unnamed protein product [Vicia faba]
MADDKFQFPTLFGEDGEDSDDEKLVMDIESFLSVLDEDCVPSESSHEDYSLKDVSPGESGTHDNFLLQNGNSSMLDYEHENRGPSSETCYSPNAFAGGYRDSFSVVESDETCYVERAGVSEREMPFYSTDTSFAEANSNAVTVCRDNLNSSLWKGHNTSQIKHVADDVESEYASHSSIIENVDGTFANYGTALKDIIGVSRQQENDSCTTSEMPFVDVDMPTHFGTSTDSTFCQETTMNMKVEKMEFLTDSANMIGGLHFNTVGPVPFQDRQFMPTDSEYPSFFPGNVIFEDSESVQQSSCAPYISCEGQSFNVKAEGDEMGMPFQNTFHNDHAELNAGLGVKQLPGNTGNLNFRSLDKSLSIARASITNGKHYNCGMSELESKPSEYKSIDDSQLSRSTEGSNDEDDCDVCIIEDISHPAPTSRSAELYNSLNMSQSSRFDYTKPHMAGNTRPKPHDEQYILRVALQDLSQPKSEVSPPDGLLAVPLLRHQRIALSWMVQKETSSLYCSGGILADDQGLGKTVSTISLILKERPPLLKTCKSAQKSVLETLDLDDDPLPENGVVKKESNACQDTSNRNAITGVNLSVHTKGRPSAGTLVVCPTSVLRQWADELHNKVTCKANLSVLVYHGSSRTKDPYELAKYDVVLTTYSIVSMEVPKQPLVDKDDGEKETYEDQAMPSKKRKCPPSSKSGKKKKGLDSMMLEESARPLAKVAWFRVVLDEAQSIKNHRTQVARACWGLRAKRRWCLSGTPIQNSIDDLYSYFRFLRYDPYAVYTSFCSTIKIPISRNPSKGYRKLQTILKTIMLRRTKGSLLDGEPIISLPPKSVELKKVEFSQEERDFYSKLEADSRAQFQEYADAGTVKQNYVNILLMLLRLRQACDHPQLVKCYNSTTLWKSSVETAMKLPREKQLFLLKCLEASLALCGICNDAPEDAVVSVCGHVFCNQCISEHLTGEDNQCPATNCKTRLNMSSVFPKATLNSSLSDQSCDLLLGYSGSEVEDSEPCSQTKPYNSSKIKAALEVLQSLSKPQCRTSQENCVPSTSKESTDCSSTSADSGKSFSDVPIKKTMLMEKSSNGAIGSLGEKAIVFSQWTGMLDLLEACLENSSIQYRRLDGTMSVVARDKAVKDFNTLPEVTVMIMSLKAASLGLNMVAACHVLMLDLWWNPTTEDQAIDRAHRIGQTRPVTVLRLTVKDTVEDRILALQEKKRKMVASAFGEDETGGRQSRLTVDDLKYLFMM